MFTKTTVLCVVAIFAVFIQIQAFNPHSEPVVRNDAENLLKKLEKTVDKALLQAQDALDKAKIQVNKTAESIESAARAQMQSTEDKLKKELDALKEKAAKAGVNIDGCLAGNEDKLVNLPNVLSDDMVHCVSDEINQGIKFAQDALDKIKNVVAEVENIRQKIKDCGHGFKAVRCIAKLAVKIDKDITSLPTQIEADATATVVLISQLQDKVKKCASDKVDNCEKEGQKIILTISTCVAAKIVG